MTERITVIEISLAPPENSSVRRSNNGNSSLKRAAYQKRKCRQPLIFFWLDPVGSATNEVWEQYRYSTSRAIRPYGHTAITPYHQYHRYHQYHHTTIPPHHHTTTPPCKYSRICSDTKGPRSRPTRRGRRPREGFDLRILEMQDVKHSS